MRAILTVAALFLAGCTTASVGERALPISRVQAVGGYSSPVLITWAHRYTLREDGRAEYHVEYDSLRELPGGKFQTGHSYYGQWRLKSETEVVVTFRTQDQQERIFVLRSVTVNGEPALIQVSPQTTLDGYTALEFRKEPAELAGSTDSADTPAAEQHRP